MSTLPENEKDCVRDPGRVLLRGKLWTFTDVKWCGAEPDVGIMSAYPEGFDLEDADGNLWDWDKDQLTEAEDKVVNEALCMLTHEPDDEWDGDEDRL